MLLDHFHPPVSDIRGWEGFRIWWAVNLAEHLNQYLVPPWHAEPHEHFGVAIYRVKLYRDFLEPPGGFPHPGGHHPGPPQMTVSLPKPSDTAEVPMPPLEGEREIIGVVNFVSPANKDQPQHREEFVRECQSLLHQGIGVVVVDIVTLHGANLHVDLLEKLGAIPPDDTADLYAAAYHPIKRGAETFVEVWYKPLTTGNEVTLPPIVLFLRDGPSLLIDVKGIYHRACKQARIFRDLKFIETLRQQME